MSTKPAEFTVQSHFEGKAPHVRQTYERLLRATRQWGPVIEEPKKTSIHLVNASAFAGVATRKGYLLLNIKSDHRLDSPRFQHGEQVSAGRFHQEVKLSSPDEVDAELLGWLQAAYSLSA
jgi:hypothetical protein